MFRKATLEGELSQIFIHYSKSRLLCKVCDQVISTEQEIVSEPAQIHSKSNEHIQKLHLYFIENQEMEGATRRPQKSQLGQSIKLFSLKKFEKYSQESDQCKEQLKNYLFRQIVKIPKFQELKENTQKKYYKILEKFYRYLFTLKKDHFSATEAFDFLNQQRVDQRDTAVGYLMEQFNIRFSLTEKEQLRILKKSQQLAEEAQMHQLCIQYSNSFHIFLTLLKKNNEKQLFIIAFLISKLQCEIKQLLSLKISQLKNENLFKLFKVSENKGQLRFEGEELKSMIVDLQKSLKLKDDDSLISKNQSRRDLTRMLHAAIQKIIESLKENNELKGFIQNITLNQIKTISKLQSEQSHQPTNDHVSSLDDKDKIQCQAENDEDSNSFSSIDSSKQKNTKNGDFINFEHHTQGESNFFPKLPRQFNIDSDPFIYISSDPESFPSNIKLNNSLSKNKKIQSPNDRQVWKCSVRQIVVYKHKPNFTHQRIKTKVIQKQCLISNKKKVIDQDDK